MTRSAAPRPAPGRLAKLEAVNNDRFVEADGTLWTSRGGKGVLSRALKVIRDVVDNVGGK